MKLWIDDVRMPPDDTWVWIKTSQDAVREIFASIYGGNWFNEPITEISFDHDLGPDSEHDGAYIATSLEGLSYDHHQYGEGLRPIIWHVHSANPVGAANIRRAMESAERFWNNPSTHANVEDIG